MNPEKMEVTADGTPARQRTDGFIGTLAKSI